MTLQYTAVFAGRTKDGEQIFLYRDSANRLYLKHGDGPLQLLGPDTSITHHIDRVNESIRVDIRSPQWLGSVVATRYDLVVEEGFDLPEAVTEDHIVRGEE